MEEFKKKGINIQTETIEELREEYENMIKTHQKYLYEKITEIVHQQLRGIDERTIQSLIDKYLLTELNYNGKYTINKLDEGLQKAFTDTVGTAKNDNKKELLKSYVEKITIPLRKNKTDWAEIAITEFNRQFSKKIAEYFSSFKGISDNNLNRILDNINSDIRQLTNQYKNKFNQEYQAILKTFIRKNITKVSNLINETNLTKLAFSNLKKYFAIIQLSNHQLIEENDKFYIKNKDTNEKSELIFDGDILSSKDNKIKYYIDNKKKRIVYLNYDTQISLMFHDQLITLIPPKDKEEENNAISFSKSNHKYQFYHNLKPETDPQKIKYMIAEIEKYAPGIYDKLIYDLDFGSVLIQIKNNDHHQEENPEKKEIPVDLPESDEQDISTSNIKQHK